MPKKNIHRTPLDTTPHRSRSLKKGRVFAIACLGILSILIASGGGWYWWFSSHYAFTFYPGVTVLEQDLGGMTVEEAKTLFAEKITNLQENGITVAFEKTTLNLTPTILPLDAASPERILYEYNIDATISQAYAVGHQGGRIQHIRDQWKAYHKGIPIEVQYTIHPESIEPLIDETFAQFETPAKNADIFVQDNGSLKTTPEQPGFAFNRSDILNSIESAVRSMESKKINIILHADVAVITESDIEKNRDLIEHYLAQAPVTLRYEENEWTFDKNTVATWLSFESDTLAVHPKRLEESISEIIDTINTAPQEGRWQPVIDENDTVTDIIPLVEPKQGKTIDTEKTAADISTALEKSLNNATPTEPIIDLSVDVTEPKYTKESVKNLGIVDVLGRGTSNMAGSPANRIVNIERGAQLLDGLIIEPDAVFSLNETLRPYTAENGYLSELVIVGDKTIPEYGGGLCQIGTTTFRTAMNSGLDIIERSAHSYAVSYYFAENGLPGTDATIYDQVVDFKFKNDTGHPILLNTEVAYDGTLTFTMTGKNDGRKGYFSLPTISGWVSPPPTKEIPDETLAPGERVCTESAHDGTSAQFNYFVDHPDGTRHEETFTSYYKPWQAVCRVGVEKEKPEDEKDIPETQEDNEEKEEKNNSEDQ